MKEKIGIIGFGHMGQAICHAIVSRLGWQVVASDLGSPKNHPYLKNHRRKCCKGKISLIRSNLDVLRGVSVLILAVRPLQMKEVLNEIRSETTKPSYPNNTPLLISIAAGISLKFLIKHGGTRRVVRVMPNLPAQIGMGMSVWKASSKVSRKEKILVSKILESFGGVMEIQNENLINAATAVSGSGPGYVFAFLAALQEAAEKLGFTNEQAKNLALQTVLGSGEYAKIQVSKPSQTFAGLAKRVQTKGGTTEAAFKILKKGKWGETIGKAIHQAFIRVKEFRQK